MSHIDPALGKDLPEHDYGGNCLIYDNNNTENPWHNVWVRPNIKIIKYGNIKSVTSLNHIWIVRCGKGYDLHKRSKF